MSLSPIGPIEAGQGPRDKINAAIGAVNDLQGRTTTLEQSLGSIRQSVTSETAARQQRDAQEKAEREAADEGIRESTATDVDRLRRSITAETARASEAELAEQQARAAGDAALQRSLDGKADSEDLLPIAAQSQAAERAAATVATTLKAETASTLGRPGGAPQHYTFAPAAASLGGASAAALPTLSDALLAYGDNGRVARITGLGVLAARSATAVEPGRLYRARFVVQRRSDPTDPAGDTVRCGVVYLDQSMRVVGGVTRLRDYPGLLTAHGRQECQALISRTPGQGGAFVAPHSARFAIPVVQFFGPDHLTDCEVLVLDDVTNAFVLPAPTADFDARLAALESADIQARLRTLESEAGTPSKLTFGSKGDASYGRIADSVQVIELLGRRFAGDGGGGLYVRTPLDPPPDGDFFVSHGATFVRAQVAADVAMTLLTAAFELYARSLPDRLPDDSGRAWLNNGTIAVTS